MRGNQNYDRTLCMLDDRATGMTYAEIGEKYGVTRQRVGQICGKWNKYNFKVIKEKGCIYKNLRKWMNDNSISRVELAMAVGVEVDEVECYAMQAFRYMLLGLRPFPDAMINRLVSITGLRKQKLLEKGE